MEEPLGVLAKGLCMLDIVLKLFLGRVEPLNWPHLHHGVGGTAAAVYPTPPKAHYRVRGIVILVEVSIW